MPLCVSAVSQQMHGNAPKYGPPPNHLAFPFDHLYRDVKQKKKIVSPAWKKAL